VMLLDVDDGEPGPVRKLRQLEGRVILPGFAVRIDAGAAQVQAQDRGDFGHAAVCRRRDRAPAQDAVNATGTCV